MRLNVGIGPFLRYYFLPTDNRINILAETGIQFFKFFGADEPLGHEHTFSISSGPVIFLNSSVGLEIMANYEIYSAPIIHASSKTFLVTIGLQIHLEKDTNQ